MRIPSYLIEYLGQGLSVGSAKRGVGLTVEENPKSRTPGGWGVHTIEMDQIDIKRTEVNVIQKRLPPTPTNPNQRSSQHQDE
jgi:hypothetical protein